MPPASWPPVFWVALGGALGSVARYAVALATARVWEGTSVVGTFVVNVLGSFLLALSLPWLVDPLGAPTAWRWIWAIGFCGGFTTYSSFHWELWQHAAQGKPLVALGYLVGTLVFGALATALGLWLSRAALAS